MTAPDWEGWVGQALKGKRLHEPPAETLRDALALGRRLRHKARLAPPDAPTSPDVRDTPASGRGRGSRWASSWGLAAAAVLVLAVGGAVVLLRAPGPPLPARGSETIVRGTRVELIIPHGDLDSAPRLLAWSGSEGAVSYRARVVTADDTVLWERTVADEAVVLSEELRGRIVPGVVYRWTVDALSEEGSVLARSEPARFRVAP